MIYDKLRYDTIRYDTVLPGLTQYNIFFYLVFILPGKLIKNKFMFSTTTCSENVKEKNKNKKYSHAHTN